MKSCDKFSDTYSRKCAKPFQWLTFLTLVKFKSLYDLTTQASNFMSEVVTTHFILNF